MSPTTPTTTRDEANHRSRRGHRYFWAFVVLWSLSMAFTTFFAIEALYLPPMDEHNAIAKLIGSPRDQQRVLFPPWIIAAFIAYIVGPIVLLVIVCRTIMAVIQRPQKR